MWDGCVGIVLGFDTKDGCVVVGAWLLAGWEMVVLQPFPADNPIATQPSHIRDSTKSRLRTAFSARMR